MEISSDLAVYYQILELPINATEQEIKMAYRQLARRYHPDLNKSDRNAEDRFKQITLAYKTLLTALKQSPQAFNLKSYSAAPNPATAKEPRSASGRVRFHVQNSAESKVSPSILSPEDSWLKHRTLSQIYGLLKRRKWQQAVDVAERLAARFPGDADVCRWQALTYQRWASNLLDRKQYDQARIYLKKALKTDPHNQKLWLEIDRDYKRIERQLKL